MAVRFFLCIHGNITVSVVHDVLLFDFQRFEVEDGGTPFCETIFEEFVRTRDFVLRVLHWKAVAFDAFIEYFFSNVYKMEKDFVGMLKYQCSLRLAIFGPVTSQGRV